MTKTAAQRMRESRERKRNAQQAESATDVAQQAERNTSSATDRECDGMDWTMCKTCEGPSPGATCLGPLSVYSPERWSFLQSRGHVWDADRQRSFRPAEHGTRVIGVTVPGDPAYDGIVDRARLQAEADKHLEATV